jgi:site-specific DNA-cytosine methylase
VANGLSYWMDEPRGVPRVTVDQKNRPQRLRMLGNAIVPQIAMQIGLALKEDMKNDI